MANLNKKRAKKLKEEYVEPEVISFDDFLNAKLITNLHSSNVLALTFGMRETKEIYTIAIPSVMARKLTKEELRNGESGIGSTGLQETTEQSENAIEAGGEEDSGSDESQNEGTATE